MKLNYWQFFYVYVIFISKDEVGQTLHRFVDKHFFCTYIKNLSFCLVRIFINDTIKSNVQNWRTTRIFFFIYRVCSGGTCRIDILVYWLIHINKIFYDHMVISEREILCRAVYHTARVYFEFCNIYIWIAVF